MKIKAMVLGATLVVAAGSAAAGDAKLGDVAIQGAWARATAGQAKNGAAFMTVVNAAKQADQIVAASAPVSAKTELHTHIKDGDVMKMRQVPAIDLGAGQTVTLQPGGLHVMFIDLKEPLKEGASFPLTLKFAKAGDVQVTVEVKAAGAMNAAPMQHQMKH